MMRRMSVMLAIAVGLVLVDASQANAGLFCGCWSTCRVRTCRVRTCRPRVRRCAVPVCYAPCWGYDAGWGYASGCGDVSFGSDCGGCGGNVVPGSDPPAYDGGDAPAPQTPQDTVTYGRSLRRGVQYVTYQGSMEGADLMIAGRELMQASITGRNEQPAIVQGYFEAVVARRAGMTDVAAEKLSAAIAAESTSPIRNWGSLMERFQGADRRWVEDARYAAR